jgi:hypothetical protein
VARLAGGTEVLIWDGDGYEWDGRRFQRTFPLGLKNPYDKFSAVPAGADGFIFVSARKLFEVQRGKKPVRHGPKWRTVMGVLPGPAGGLLVREGSNPDDDVDKLYFPADKTFLHVPRELLGDWDLYDFLCYSQSINRILASDHHNLYSVPAEMVLAQPRYHVRTGKEVKA